MMKKKLFGFNPIALVITYSWFALIACHSPKNDPIPANTGTLRFHIHTNVGSNEVEEMNEIYQLADGRKISVSKAQLFISGIQLVKDDDSFYDLEGKIVLTNQGVEEYILGTVPTGKYKGLRFNIGLNSEQNSKTPSSSDTALNNSEMWFGSTAQPNGYVFINFQGKIDTSASVNGSESQMQPFIYKIGTNASLKLVIMPEKNFVIYSKQTSFVHLKADFSKLFNGLELNIADNLEFNSLTKNEEPLNTILNGNINSIFSY